MLSPSAVLFLKMYARYRVSRMPARKIRRANENLPTVIGYSPTCQSSVSLNLEIPLPQRKPSFSSLL